MLCAGQFTSVCRLPIPACNPCKIKSMEPKHGKIERRTLKKGGAHNPPGASISYIPIMASPEHVRFSGLLDFVVQDRDRRFAFKYSVEDVIGSLDIMYTRTVITGPSASTQVTPHLS